MTKRIMIWLLVIAACTAAMGSKAACGSMGTTARYGLSGILNVDRGKIHGIYRYDGKQGRRNVQGYLQWKPWLGYKRWYVEGDPTVTQSGGEAIRGETIADAGGGYWRLRITSTAQMATRPGYGLAGQSGSAGRNSITNG